MSVSLHLVVLTVNVEKLTVRLYALVCLDLSERPQLVDLNVLLAPNALKIKPVLTRNVGTHAQVLAVLEPNAKL